MAGSIGGDAVAGFSFADDGSGSGGWAGEARISRRGKRVLRHQRAVDEGRVWASRRDDMEARGNAPRLHVHRAMVLAIAATTGGQLRIVGTGGERGRDQRKAEEKQQQDAERTSHEVIVLETSEKPEPLAV